MQQCCQQPTLSPPRPAEPPETHSHLQYHLASACIIPTVKRLHAQHPHATKTTPMHAFKANACNFATAQAGNTCLRRYRACNSRMPLCADSIGVKPIGHGTSPLATYLDTHKCGAAHEPEKHTMIMKDLTRLKKHTAAIMTCCCIFVLALLSGACFAVAGHHVVT